MAHFLKFTATGAGKEKGTNQTDRTETASNKVKPDSVRSTYSRLSMQCSICCCIY